MTLEILDVFGHVFYASLAFGMFMLARKSSWGWVFRFIGEAGWLWIGIEMGMSSIWGWGALFLCMDAFGLYRWTRKEPVALLAEEH
jgi:hypothetical protein